MALAGSLSFLSGFEGTLGEERGVPTSFFYHGYNAPSWVSFVFYSFGFSFWLKAKRIYLKGLLRDFFLVLLVLDLSI